MERQQQQRKIELRMQGRIGIVGHKDIKVESLTDAFLKSGYETAQVCPDNIQSDKTQNMIEKFNPNGWILVKDVPFSLLGEGTFKVALLPDEFGIEDKETISHHIAKALDNKGFDFAVAEPVSPEVLIAYVGAIMRRQENKPITTRSGIVFDLENSRVLKDGQLTFLTKTETLMLKTLAYGSPLSSSEFSTAVWGYAESTDLGKLRTHIRNIRRKIEDNPKKPQIIKKVGLGYTLE